MCISERLLATADRARTPCLTALFALEFTASIAPRLPGRPTAKREAIAEGFAEKNVKYPFLFFHLFDAEDYMALCVRACVLHTLRKVENDTCRKVAL